MITPTVGRIVWVRQRSGSLDAQQPEGARIVYVHSVSLVNVAGEDANGQPFILTSLFLSQDGSRPVHEEAPYAEWMPYQTGQAAKTEELRDR